MEGFKKNNKLGEAFFGHKGRKGQRGGSLPSKSRGGAPTNSTTKKVKMGSEGTEVRVPTGGNVRGRGASAAAKARFGSSKSAKSPSDKASVGAALSKALGGGYTVKSISRGNISVTVPAGIGKSHAPLPKLRKALVSAGFKKTDRMGSMGQRVWQHKSSGIKGIELQSSDQGWMFTTNVGKTYPNTSKD